MTLLRIIRAALRRDDFVIRPGRERADLMYSPFSLLGKGAALLALLLAASSLHAQTSPAGHVPARTPYPQRIYAGAPAFRIYPGDHMFQAGMKIAHYYQEVERAAPVAAYHPPARRTPEPETAAPVAVSITEPAGETEMIPIRGPNGEVRSFPILGGRKAIKARTIIVHPGQSLHLTVYGGHVTVARK